MVRWLLQNILPQHLAEARGLLEVNAEPISGKLIA